MGELDVIDAATSQNESDAPDIPASLTCAVCRDLFLRPRSFPCGHSFCGECHINIDMEAERQHAARSRASYARLGERGDEVVAYACPMCRATTNTGWRRRPINVALQSLASEHPHYAQREAAQENSVIESITGATPVPRGESISSNVLNLRELATTHREQLAESVYIKVLPELYMAATSGKSSVSFNADDIVTKSKHMLDLLSARLFKHGCWRVEMNRTFTTLTVHMVEVDVGRVYTNDEYNSETEDESPVVPHAPSPPDARRRLADLARAVSSAATTWQPRRMLTRREQRDDA